MPGKPGKPSPEKRRWKTWGCWKRWFLRWIGSIPKSGMGPFMIPYKCQSLMLKKFNTGTRKSSHIRDASYLAQTAHLDGYINLTLAPPLMDLLGILAFRFWGWAGFKLGVQSSWCESWVGPESRTSARKLSGFETKLDYNTHIYYIYIYIIITCCFLNFMIRHLDDTWWTRKRANQ